MGDNSQGEFYSVALTNNYQQADTGTKMIHIGKNSRSRIISKGISADSKRSTYNFISRHRVVLEAASSSLAVRQ